MKKHVFVLEDDDGLRELFTLLLEAESFKVDTFPTVESFRIGLAQQQPDLIIMDVMLPDGNGLEVSIAIRADQRTSGIPIIMMSAHRNFNQDKGNSPAEEFIAKPFDVDYLLERINHYIG
ncbi:response regulator transcription factor [Pedobacter xixiisoli]|uniref:Response regulator receiver domain-containing protein n=1 Tax=Pedobacter xixiisoli TaxID=1476464 RepID=A0A285ZWC4_9SPHI|nr:response regulator [Pedobacter xixiisoli]SOD13944.1 Response regulator receiver domain-containing protein [Pedobacter xixiisoli]